MSSSKQFFYWIGLSTHHKDTSKLNNKLRKFAPALFNFIIIFTELYITYTFGDYIIHSRSPVGALTDYVQVYAMIFTTIILVGETQLKGNLDVKLTEMMHKIDEDLFKVHLNHCVRCNCKQIKFKSNCKELDVSPSFLTSILIIVVSSGMELIVVITLSEDECIWQHSIYVRLWSSNMSRIALLHVSLYILWIVNRLKWIEKELAHIVKANFKKTLYQKNLTKLKMVFCQLWDFYRFLNTRFSWTIFSIITIYFLCIVVSFYWVLVRIYHNRFKVLIRK